MGKKILKKEEKEPNKTTLSELSQNSDNIPSEKNGKKGNLVSKNGNLTSKNKNLAFIDNSKSSFKSHLKKEVKNNSNSEKKFKNPNFQPNNSAESDTIRLKNIAEPGALKPKNFIESRNCAELQNQLKDIPFSSNNFLASTAIDSHSNFQIPNFPLEKGLGKFPLFQNLPSDKLLQLERALRLKRVKSGEIIFLAGEAPYYLHLIFTGKASVFKTSRKGREVIINTFTAPAVVAELANLTGMPFPASCKMEEEGVVGRLPFYLVEKFLQQEGICYHLLKSLAKKMKYLDRVIHENLLISTDAKIAKFLYENGELLNQLKQYQIANLLNLQPETLSRKLSKFKRLGLLKKENGKWELINRHLLPTLFPWK